ncbi:MAG: FAD:protein FMN transferase [Telluria sp.]
MVAVYTIEFKAMGGPGTIRIAADDQAHARALAQPAIDEVRRIEQKYSRYRDDSIIARINAQAGKGWTACDDETLRLLDYAGTLFEASDGLFDITSGVLRLAWDFNRPALPDPKLLDECLSLVGFQHVQRDGDWVRLAQAGMELDFGGFGKEYAADCAAAKLAAQGVTSGYVDLAGDMRFLGPKPDGTPWMIGIQDPRRPDAVIATIPVIGGALATSGDYERYFDLHGRRYCHILNPRSGQPVTHWRSVSVLAPLAIAAGGTSTIAMLLQAGGLEFLRASKMPWLAVDQNGKLQSS